jgi:hypothetical protein
MQYLVFASLALGAGWILTSYAMSDFRLGAVESALVGCGVGLVGTHGILLLLMLFLPFVPAFDLSLALAGVACLYPICLKDFQVLRQWFRTQLSIRRAELTMSSIIAGALLVGLLAWYANVYFSTLVRLPGGGYAGAFAGYGDVPYHMAQVSHLAAGTTLKLDDPTYAGSPLKYPFFINFISATLLRLGAPLIVAFHFPAFFFASTGILLLYCLFKRLASSRLIAFGGVLLVLFASNGRYLLMCRDPFFKETHSLRDTLTHLGHLAFDVGVAWNALFPDQNRDITAVLPHFLLHQRASIMGFWSVLALVFLWLELLERQPVGSQRTFRKATVPIAIILALLPLLHTHGFVAIVFAASGWVLFSLLKRDGQRRLFLIALLWIGPLVLWEVAYLLQPHSDYTYRPQFRFGWMTNPGEIGGIRLDPTGREPILRTWLRFTWQNFGVLQPVSLMAAVLLTVRYGRSVSRDRLWLFVPGTLALLVIPNLVKFQAWDFDSNKFFLFGILFEVAIVMMCFGEVAKKSVRLAISLLTILLAAAIPTGLLDMYARTTVIKPSLPILFDKDSALVGSWVWRATPPEAVFVTSDNHLNPVNCLGGRSVLLGFKGWLWTHGISYGERDSKITAFIRNPSQKSLALLKAHYVLVDSQWRNQYPELEGKLYRDFGAPVFSAGQYKVWKL